MHLVVCVCVWVVVNVVSTSQRFECVITQNEHLVVCGLLLMLCLQAKDLMKYVYRMSIL